MKRCHHIAISCWSPTGYAQVAQLIAVFMTLNKHDVIAMRKNRFYFLVFISLIIWAIATYFLFQHKPTNYHASETSDIEKQLHNLEGELKNQFKANEAFLKNLKVIIQNQQIEIKNAEKERNTAIQLEKEKLQEQSRLNPSSHKEKIQGPVIAVLVFACNRPSVSRCLDALIKYRPQQREHQFPIVVSQDCDHEETARVIGSYGANITHIRTSYTSEIVVPLKEKKFKGYFKIARHYGWALNHTFFGLNYDTVIIVEDDLDIAPDFFEYFLGLYPILKQDRTLFCVSAWNDNGKSSIIDNYAADLLYRTDFFPGLGWMLLKDHWIEHSTKWPPSYWDDWIRRPEQRKDRACIRPEISRTRTFGKHGVSNGLFFEKHLKYIKLNEKFVPFTKMNLTYLLKDNYDIKFVQEVYNSSVVTLTDLKDGSIKHNKPVRIQYNTKDIYKITAKMLGLMDDFKSGVPRTGYRGIVSFFCDNRRVYLAPNADWKQYDPTWS
ncbi:alpha-1,3-mannosyl-glycoprotein 2-beta-N-acetylglucosaminyltransferase isoform X3 [Neocloeon triangulifer]|uniref:alpha-1,3-mannosyl-glycoprotein 2-beta-N-acetylglucosaminyltransferase isoform X3 n=2 Tax=Neocloeon triangulifer TaxID=2078957 RepID=UPI00286FA261|nr:alpha-1,3-mannosyl-glycoprotein 2-beta-N-acetylglucosaminyltransferase isoform X3 [Neocloeon triangulifer]